MFIAGSLSAGAGHGRVVDGWGQDGGWLGRGEAWQVVGAAGICRSVLWDGADRQRCASWRAEVSWPRGKGVFPGWQRCVGRGVGRREGWGADACRAAMKGGMPRPVEGGGCRLLSQREIGRAVERQKPLAHGVDKGDGLGV